MSHAPVNGIMIPVFQSFSSADLLFLPFQGVLMDFGLSNTEVSLGEQAELILKSCKKYNSKDYFLDFVYIKVQDMIVEIAKHEKAQFDLIRTEHKGII